MKRACLAACSLLLAFCRGTPSSSATPPAEPLALIADVPLPGRAVRFDYQDIDASRRRLFIAHMNDASVVVVSLQDDKLVKVIGNIPTPRGVAVAASAQRVFVTSSPNQLVIIDSETLTEVERVPAGNGPDGVAWDPAQRLVGVSDQRDGALSLIADAGTGKRTQVALGRETGNVVFDAVRGEFWLTVVVDARTSALFAVDPLTGKINSRIGLPGCDDAHGLRLHPDGKSALVACEGNSKVARAALDGSQPLTLATSGADPDVLAVDAGLGWLYVAAESGDVRVFDLLKPGLASVGAQRPGPSSHSVAVDPATHRVYFPLAIGPKGSPVLRIMRPAHPGH